MVSLAKLDGLSFFSADGTAQNGVAFLPEVDSSAAQINLSTTEARSGFFLTWSGEKQPSAEDLAGFDAALRDAREAATATSRLVLQCFRTGQNTAVHSLIAEGSDPVISAARLVLSDKTDGSIDAAFRLSVTACRLAATDDFLQFEPIDEQHGLISTATEILFDKLVMPLAGPLAGTFGGACHVGPEYLARNHFIMEISARGLETDDGDGDPSYFKVDREERPPLVGGGPNGEAPLSVDVSLDLVDLLNQNRTFLKFNNQEPLHSNFRTTHGHKVLLTPLVPQSGGPEAGFSYVLRQDRQNLAGTPVFRRVNLLLEGDFQVSLANEDDTPAQMPPSGFGIVISDSQHEYLQVPGGNNAGVVIMSFQRGAAHIGDDTDQALVSVDDGLTATDGHDLTSWARVTRQGSDPTVISEARDIRRLDRNAATAMAAGEGGLIHNPFPLQRKVNTDQLKPDRFVPVLPRSKPKTSALAKIAEDRKPSITSRLAAERRKLLDVKSTTFASFAAPEAKTTPIGFELEETSGGVTKITIARTLAPRPKPGTEASDAKLELIITSAKDGAAIAPRFVNDIVRNQLFMVANTSGSSDPTSVDGIKLEGVLTLSEWGFNIRLPTIDAYKMAAASDEQQELPPPPLVIIKGFEGQSISDLIDKEQLWSGFSYLHAHDGQTPVGFAKAQFKHAVQHATDANDPIYAPLLAAIGDPKWTGVLILSVPIAPAVLPDQVRGLLGGIDLNRLRAHHFAIPVRRLTASGEGSLSKPFAAVDYRASEKAPPPRPDESGDFDGPGQAPNGSDAGFDMKVTVLKVGFNNGAIQSFACKLDLQVGAFFHDTGIELKKPNGEIAEDKKIELQGRWSRRVVDGQTLETYDFFTESAFEIKMGDDFPLLEKAKISRIGYVAETAGADKELVTSKFLINGDMDFKELPGFDFLDVKTTKFTGLSIDLRFKIRGDKVTLPKFRFSPGALEFDFDASELKKKARGFFGSLPLKFKGFGWLGGAFDLPDLGYFALGKGTGGKAPFMLKFDLDLGSLGSFASALSKFKMELGFSFGIDAHKKFNWNLGMRFAGSGGKDLDIGLQGFLQLTCEKYEVVGLKQGSGEVYYGFRGVNARLIVFEQPLPPEKDNVNVFIFLDPAKLGQAEGLGWLLAYSSEPSGDIIDVRRLVLGQRVEALKNLPAGKVTTRSLVGALGALAEEPGVQPDSGKPYKIPDVTFAPDRDWTIGFHAMIYRFIELGFAVRDPDLAGLLLDVKLEEGSSQSLFSVDILYRKLTEDLGVYSAEIVLPPELRNWQFGAAGITLPVIGVEIYTDGNWGIDLGYPANKDFSRSFAMSIFPFVGAGGLYYRRVSGPAATLVPRQIKHDSAAPGVPAHLAYDPVTEFGMGFRVGLGVVLAQGILNAGLSLTVYGYLEGAFGRLQNPDRLPTKARKTYIVVAGAVGVMGELYGYVDFGIVKAGVFVQLYVEIGFRLETDKAIELYYEVGVSVQVRVVIARIRVFGRGIEIAISFSFKTKVRFSQFIGHDQNREYYDGGSGLLPFTAAEPFEWRTPDWSKTPSPAEWTDGLTGKVPLEVAIQPDITIAPNAGGEAELHAVFLMSAEFGKETAVITSAERLVQGLTAWALCAHMNIAPAALRGTKPDLGVLRDLSARLAARDSTVSIANYSNIRDFLTKAFDGKVREPVELSATPEKEDKKTGKQAPAGMIVPMPETMIIQRYLSEHHVEAIRLTDYSFVDVAYRQQLEAAFKRFLIEQGKAPAMTVAALADAKQSLTSVLFEEWVLMIMRSGIDQLRRIVETKSAATFGTALDEFVAPFEAEGHELRSMAAETGAMVSRFFSYGQRIPLPEGADDHHIPDGQEMPKHTGDPNEPFFHAMLRLAGQQMPIGNVRSLRIPAMTYDNWLVVPTRLDFDLREDVDASKIVEDARALNMGGSLGPGKLYRLRRRYVALGSQATASKLRGSALTLWSYSKEARALAAQDPEMVPTYYRADAAGGPGSNAFAEIKADEAAHLQPAIVIDVSLRRPDGTKDGVKVLDAFEIKGIGEPLRALIDPFAPTRDGGMAEPPAIDWIKICKVGADGETLQPIGVAEGHKATLIQTNLSVEARPETMMLTASERDRIDPVADTDAPLAFLRLLRQAAIVNTGGYHLAYPGASAELADLFAETATPNALDAGARLRVVIALAKTAKAHSFSNALLVATAYEAGTVIAVRDDDTADPMHEPGILPIEANKPRKIGTTNVQIELAERFSNLALEVEIRDAAGALLGTQFRDQSFPIGPDMDDAANEPGYTETIDENGEPTHYRYRASVPVSNIANVATENAYGLVGGKVRLRGVWRDIYGNNWPGDFGEQEINLVYSDRLLGLTGLPYIKAAYWPVAERKIAIALTSDYAASLELDGSTADPNQAPADEWVRSAHEDIDRSIALLKRAIAQLTDTRVTVSARSALGKDSAMKKGKIIDHLTATHANLAALKDLIVKGKARKEMKQDMTVWLQNRRHETKEDVSFAPGKAENFKEMSVTISVQRPDPERYPDFYDKTLRGEAEAEVKAEAEAEKKKKEEGILSARPPKRHRQLVDDVSRTVEIVAPNISTIATDASVLATDPLPGGDTADYMAALALTAVDHRIAVGYGDIAGVTEKATWLIARSYLQDISDGSLFTDAKHIAMGLPPLQTEAYSQSFTELQSPDKTTFSREIRDADADAYGREALMRIERLLSPSVSVKLLNAASPPQQAEVRGAIDAMLGIKEDLAERLAARLEPVFAADVNALRNYADEREKRPKDALADLLKRDLRNHYKITSLLLYLDPTIDGIPKMTRAAQGVVTVGDAKMRVTNYSMPLALDDNATSRDLVVFCEALPDPGSANGISPSLPLPLTFDLPHIQKWPRYDISTGEVSYRKSSWLKLYDDTPAGAKSWLSLGLPRDGLVPNPLRRLPEMPSLDREFFETDDYVDDQANPLENLKNARQWRSIRDFRWEGLPQDRLTVELHYGSRGEIGSFAAKDNPTTALVKFVLESDRAMLGIENGGIAEYVWLAKRAQEIFGRQPALAGPMAHADTAKMDRITLQEETLESGLGVRATGIELFGDAAVPRKFTYRAPTGIGNDFGAGVEFERDSTDDLKPLPAAIDKPGAWKLRRLETDGLDILDAASARTSLSLTRNEEIAGEPLQESFIYRLPTIASGQDIVPSLDRGGTISVGKFNPESADSVASALNVFLAGLLGKDGQTVSGYTTDLIFEYEPVPFTEDGSSGVVEMGGPIIAIRSGFDPTNADSVKTLAEEIHTWFQTEHPAKNNGLPIGSTIIDARVFVSGGTDVDQRVLRLLRCQLEFDGS